ncbi:tRNA lysidine(34) synthetase TilS [Thermaurantiacus sp.]
MRGLTPADLAATTAALLAPASAHAARLALAVSGGADSLALLVLGASAFPGRVVALTFDHGLRAESRAEAESVALVAARLGVPHCILAPDRPIAGSSLQAAARDARYQAMAAWCRGEGFDALLTAHHQDDQAETLLLRLARGSGIAGLAGVRAATAIAGVRVLRPLLAWPRAALADVTAAAGLTPVDDPANRDPRFDRTRARALLADTKWLDPARLAASAHHLAEAEEALSWAAARAKESRTERTGDRLFLDPEGLPAELRRRLLAQGLAELGAPRPAGPALARLLTALEAGKTATLGSVKARPLANGRWALAPAPLRRRPAA